MSLLDRVPVPRTAGVDEQALRRAVEGRTILLTGASSGIGAATATRLGAAGARLVLVARRRAELEAVAAGLHDAVVAPCDLSDPGAVDALTAQARELGVDALVSNAGHSIRRSVSRSPDIARDAERLMAINYLGPVRLIGALLGDLAAVRGQVVCVSSIAAQSSSPGFAAYAASKAALDTFIRALAQERAASGVAFTAVNMPLVRTPMVGPSEDLTAAVASLSPENAADLVASAIVHRPRRIGTPAGELAAIGWALDPAITTAIDRRLRRIPGSGGGRGGGGRTPLGRLGELAFKTTVRR